MRALPVRQRVWLAMGQDLPPWADLLMTERVLVFLPPSQVAEQAP